MLKTALNPTNTNKERSTTLCFLIGQVLKRQHTAGLLFVSIKDKRYFGTTVDEIRKDYLTK